MKYVRTKSNEIRTTNNSGHHKDLATAKTIKSAGRFTIGKDGSLKIYSKSYHFNVYPDKGDAKLIKKRITGG